MSHLNALLSEEPLRLFDGGEDTRTHRNNRESETDEHKPHDTAATRLRHLAYSGDVGKSGSSEVVLVDGNQRSRPCLRIYQTAGSFNVRGVVMYVISFRLDIIAVLAFNA